MTHPPPLPKIGPVPWRKRHPTAFNWAVGVGGAVVLTGFVVFVFSIVFGFLKSSDAYVGALARAKASPAVVAALGTPLHESWLVTGKILVRGPTGVADLAIPISGPKGGATIYVGATKYLGEWHFNHLVVQLDDTHQRIDLAPAPPTAPRVR